MNAPHSAWLWPDRNIGKRESLIAWLESAECRATITKDGGK